MSDKVILRAIVKAHKQDLRLSAFAALLVIRKEPVTLTTIANQLGLSTPAVTGLADRLEEKFYATRKPAPHDRRKWILTITPLGLEKIEEILK